MTATIHPYKGYLNTLFHIHATGNEDVCFSVVLASDDSNASIVEGKISPNEPFSTTIPVPGDFIVKFSDGTSIPVIVEDGYKYGGSKLKRAFIFDDSPWVFVVMHDRTYFYNRETKEAYVEAVSPDKITGITDNFVLFENNEHSEQTLYSLIEQKPILGISDILYFNKEIIVWREMNDGKTILVLYSLDGLRLIKKQVAEHFAIDKINQRIIYNFQGRVETISLIRTFDKLVMKDSFPGNIVDIVAPYLAVSYEETGYGNSLYVYNIDTNKLIKKITIDGHLATISDTQIINVGQRLNAIQDFDLSETQIPDAVISANYYEFKFYPCEWEVFYTVKHTQLVKSGLCRVDCKEDCHICACLIKFKQEIKSLFDHSLIKDNAICLYNNNESYARSKNYSGAGYREGGHIYTQGSRIYLYDDSLYTLSANGYWDNGREHKYNFEDFEEFGVITDTDSKICQTIGGLKLGKKECVMEHYLRTIEYFVFPNARILKRNGIMPPDYISDNLGYGLSIKENGVYFYTLVDGGFIETQILKDIFDTSIYHETLLSEDGKSIMYRDGERNVVINVADATSESYDNVSFIKHINGIRPLFATPSSLQPRLINPVTKQPIDCKTMLRFRFVSPNGRLYADTRLTEYIEYYYVRDERLISFEEFNKLITKYEYPWPVQKDSLQWLNIRELRKMLVEENIEFLHSKYPNIFKFGTKGVECNEYVLENINAERFLSYLIGKRGVAFIRQSADNSIYTKIELGEPLEYINYVSFSYDGRYAALAGYRSKGKDRGLFVLFDLISKETIIREDTSRAVWVTAFSESGALATYTSHPYTLFAKNEEEYKEFEDKCIDGRNFLTFSPNGEFFALSDKGYISKYNQEGQERTNWGHQPSSFVEIRKTVDATSPIVSFQDISDQGIENVATRKESVASVSFSNDNKRLMMVGKDGVVIIRNLHLGDYAGE